MKAATSKSQNTKINDHSNSNHDMIIMYYSYNTSKTLIMWIQNISNSLKFNDPGNTSMFREI